MEQPELDEVAFRDLRKQLLVTKGGHYGLAKLVGGAIDLSRRSWIDPAMYHQLMLYARQYVSIPFTSIYVGDSLKKIKRVGQMYVVSFGFYTEGELVIGSKSYNTHRRPLIVDDTTRYSPQPFVGVRYYLCYYNISQDTQLVKKSLDNYEAVYKDFKYRIACYTDGESVRYASKDEPLWKPQKRTKNITVLEESFVPNMSFTPAQNLLLRAQQEQQESSDECHNEP